MEKDGRPFSSVINYDGLYLSMIDIRGKANDRLREDIKVLKSKLLSRNAQIRYLKAR